MGATELTLYTLYSTLNNIIMNPEITHKPIELYGRFNPIRPIGNSLKKQKSCTKE